MSRDFKAIVAEVKEAYDIVDYIENTGVTLKSMGSRHKGLCCFHNEKTPSMTVDSYFQSYRCFGCGANGDILSFVQETENLSFKEALVSLAEPKGIDISSLSEWTEDSEEDKIDITSLREVVRETAIFFWMQYRDLDKNHIAKQEVRERGLTVANKHHIYGYAPEGRTRLYDHLKSKSFSDDVIETAGVCRRSQKSSQFYDFWQGRLIFIISDITGRPVGFSGRKLYDTDTRGKYVNSIDSPVFNKSQVLFNAHSAKNTSRQEKTVYVAEGQFDVMALLEAGIENSVAASGTAFTEKQSSQLRRLVGEEGSIVFCFDGDESGLKAAEKVFDVDPLLQTRAYVVRFPEGQDPCDYGMKHGYDGLAEYVSQEENRISIIRFVLRAAWSSCDMTTPEGKAQYIDKAAKILKKISNSALRREYAKQVSLDAGGVPLESIDEAVKNTSSDPRRESREEPREEKASEERGYLQEGEKKVELENRMMQAMREQTYHVYVARLLWLALARRDLCADSLMSVKNRLIPKPYHRIIDELHQYPEDRPLVVERFSEARIVDDILKHHRPSEYIVTSDDESVWELFMIITRRMVTSRIRNSREEKRASLLAIMQDGGDSSVEVLRKVIEEHEREKREVEESMQGIAFLMH